MQLYTVLLKKVALVFDPPFKPPLNAVLYPEKTHPEINKLAYPPLVLLA